MISPGCPIPSLGYHPTAGAAAEVVMQDPSLPARKTSLPSTRLSLPHSFPKPRDLLASFTWRSTANLGRKGKEHNNAPVDRFLPYNSGWTGRSTQVLEKIKTQWCQSTQSMAQDSFHRYSSSVGPSLFGTVWYCKPSHLHYHPTIEAPCIACLGLDFSTYLSMQPSVQSHESTNVLEKLLR